MSTGDIHERPPSMPTGVPDEMTTESSKDKVGAGEKIKQGFISIGEGVQLGVSSVASPALASIQKRSGNAMESLKNSGVGLFARNIATKVVIHAKFIAGEMKHIASAVTDACKNKLGFKDPAAKLLEGFNNNKSVHEKLEKGINKLVELPEHTRAPYTAELAKAKTGAATAKENFEQSQAAHTKAKSDVREALKELKISREERDHLQRQYDLLKSDDPKKEKCRNDLEIAHEKVEVVGGKFSATLKIMKIKKNEKEATKGKFEEALDNYRSVIENTHSVEQHQHIDIRSTGERIEEFAKKAEAKAEAGSKEAIRLGGEAAGAARGVAKAAYKEVKESSVGKKAADLIEEQKEKSQLLAYSKKCDQQIRMHSDLAAQYGQTVNQVMDRINLVVSHIDEKTEVVTTAHEAFKADPSSKNLVALEKAIDDAVGTTQLLSTLSKITPRELDDFFIAVQNKKTAADTSSVWEKRKNRANELFGDLQSKRQVLRQQESASRANAPVEGEVDSSVDKAKSNLQDAKNDFESFVKERIVPEELPRR